MNKETEPPERLTELPEDTRKFLAGLSKEDTATLETLLPLARSMMTWGRVSKWLIVTLLGLYFGVVMLGESVVKVLSWFKT
jgi:hypothetical protein